MKKRQNIGTREHTGADKLDNMTCLIEPTMLHASQKFSTETGTQPKSTIGRRSTTKSNLRLLFSYFLFFLFSATKSVSRRNHMDFAALDFPCLTQTWLLRCYLLLLFPALSLSDPRISQSGLFCSPEKMATKNFVPTFVKEMETLSQLLTTGHFATYHVNVTSIVPPMYGLAQCHYDLSRTDCLLCFAASRTKLPRCLPSLSAAIYLDGCFLRYGNYSFYNESTSPVIDSVKCSSDNATVAGYGGRDEFVERVGYAVGNVTRMAVGNGGFGAVSVKGVYALAQCWDSVGRDGCRECLEKARRAVRGCGVKREGRGLNAGCYLRYSDHKFFSQAAETDHHRRKFCSIDFEVGD